MRSQSNTIPDKIWVKSPDESGISTVVLRDSVVKTVVENIDGIEQDVYTYDEVVVTIPWREDIENYVDSHFNDWFQLGVRLEFERTLPVENELLMSVVTSLMLEIDTMNTRLKILEGK